MTKSLMISIQPQHAFNILNGKKTLELRTWMPKGYVGWVYVYVIKGKPYLVDFREESMTEHKYVSTTWKNVLVLLKNKVFNGKVAFRFWFDEYEEIKERFNGDEYIIEKLNELCLNDYEVKEYLGNKKGYAWHIKKLEIFDEPKELSDFYRQLNSPNGETIYPFKSFELKKPPQRSVWVYTKENDK